MEGRPPPDVEAQTDGRGATPPRRHAAETLRLYARDWAAFAAWCRAARVPYLPADAGAVTAYLTSLAHLSRGARDRRLAAIVAQHRGAGLPPPATAPARKALTASDQAARAPRRATRPTPARLLAMARGCPGDLAGLRDRALLLVMMETGIGREGVTALQAEQVKVGPLRVEILPGEAEGTPPGRIELARAPDGGLCAAVALAGWLDASGTSFGPVFRKVDRWGNLEHRRLGADAVRRILERRAPRKARLATEAT